MEKHFCAGVSAEKKILEKHLILKSVDESTFQVV